MNIYNYIYCYFYNRGRSTGSGRIDSSAYVLCTIITHVLLLSEIIQDTTGLKLVRLPNYGGAGINKNMYLLFVIPLWVGLIIFYNKTRTKRLLGDYHRIYGEAGSKNTQRIFLYIVFPVILLVTLAVIRQQT